MGMVYLFECEACHYRAEVAGGQDCGFIAHTETCACKNCGELMDLTVGLMRPNESGQLEFQPRKETRCSYCRSRRVTRWVDGMPCPKCSGAMVKDPSFAICWD